MILSHMYSRIARMRVQEMGDLYACVRVSDIRARFRAGGLDQDLTNTLPRTRTRTNTGQRRSYCQ